MPLSDREQQILSDIAARLREDDPKFARAVGKTTVQSVARRRLRLSIAAFVLGFLLLFGIVVNFWFGVAGFVLMLLGAIQGLSQLGRLGADITGSLGGQARGGPGKAPPPRGPDGDRRR